MSEVQQVKKPAIPMLFEYITSAGSRTVKAVVEDRKVRIEDESYDVDHESTYRAGKMSKAILVQGHPKALPIWGRESKITARQYDHAGHTDLIDGLDQVVKRREPKKGNVGVYVCMGILALVVIVVAIVIHGEIQEVAGALARQAAANAPPQDGVTVVGDANGATYTPSGAA